MPAPRVNCRGISTARQRCDHVVRYDYLKGLPLGKNRAIEDLPILEGASVVYMHLVATLGHLLAVGGFLCDLNLQLLT